MTPTLHPSDTVELVGAVLHISDQWYIARAGRIDWTPYDNRVDAILALAQHTEAEQAELRG